MKLVTRQQSRFGQKIVVAYLGEIKFSDKGEYQLQSHQIEQAKSLVESGGGYELLDPAKKKVSPKKEEEIKKKSEEDELNKDEGGSKINPQVEESEPLNSGSDSSPKLGPKIFTQKDLDEIVEANSDLTKEDVERLTKLIGTEVVGKLEDVEVTEEPVPLPQEVKDALIKTLEDKDFSELKEFAVENGFPNEEWETRKNGKQLKSYLIEKIQSL